MRRQPVNAPRRTFRDDVRVAAPAHAVFPLLCPVREYDWIDGWSCEIVHTDSGVAEEGCIFQTQFRDVGRMTWVVSAYEPDRRIAFTCVLHPHIVMRLTITLEPDGDNATITHWTREFTSLDPEGEPRLASIADELAHQQTMARLAAALSHYVRTGVCLRAESAAPGAAAEPQTAER